MVKVTFTALLVILRVICSDLSNNNKPDKEMHFVMDSVSVKMLENRNLERYIGKPISMLLVDKLISKYKEVVLLTNHPAN